MGWGGHAEQGVEVAWAGWEAQVTRALEMPLYFRAKSSYSHVIVFTDTLVIKTTRRNEQQRRGLRRGREIWRRFSKAAAAALRPRI